MTWENVKNREPKFYDHIYSYEINDIFALLLNLNERLEKTEQRLQQAEKIIEGNGLNYPTVPFFKNKT